MSTITFNGSSLQEVTAAWKEDAQIFGSDVLSDVEFLSAESHRNLSYRISGGAYPEGAPTVWSVQVRIHGQSFILSTGEYHDVGFGGWETAPWGLNGRYEFGGGGQYLTDSMYNAILASTIIPDSVKVNLKAEAELLWNDHKNDPFQQIAEAIDLANWVDRFAKAASKTAAGDDSVTLNCYVDQLVDNTDGKFDAFGHAWFTVPRSWANDLVKTYRSGFTDLDHFQREYTFDDTDGWLKKAIDEGVLIGCGTGNMKPARTHTANISGTEVDIEVSVNRDGDLELKGLPFPVHYEMFDETLVLTKHKSDS